LFARPGAFLLGVRLAGILAVGPVLRRWAWFGPVCAFIALAVGMIGHEAARLYGADLAGFDAGYIATVAGIVVGAPIAVRIALDQQANAKAAAEQLESERRSTTLGLIADDLYETQVELRERTADRSRAVAPFLGSGLYATLQASGDLRLIADPALVQAISRAYDRIGVTGYLERRAWETANNPQARRATSPPQTLIADSLRHVSGQDRHTDAAIDVALMQLKLADPSLARGG
jgi:hypothetical protein